MARRWTVRAEGPDAWVNHFYADTDLQEAEVVLADDYEAECALANQLYEALVDYGARALDRRRLSAIDAYRKRRSEDG